MTSCSGGMGLATMILLVQGGLWDTVPRAGLGFLSAAVPTAVVFAALLARGLVFPFVLYAWVVTTVLRKEIFLSYMEGVLHVPFLGVSSIVFVGAAALELLVRSRLRGWDGGKFKRTIGRE